MPTMCSHKRIDSKTRWQPDGMNGTARATSCPVCLGPEVSSLEREICMLKLGKFWANWDEWIILNQQGTKYTSKSAGISKSVKVFLG